MFLFRAQAIQNAIQGETYSIGVYSEDGGYFSPTIQDDMFQHVQSVQESMLLQGVDPAQLVDSIQVSIINIFTACNFFLPPLLLLLHALRKF